MLGLRFPCIRTVHRLKNQIGYGMARKLSISQSAEASPTELIDLRYSKSRSLLYLVTHQVDRRHIWSCMRQHSASFSRLYVSYWRATFLVRHSTHASTTLSLLARGFDPFGPWASELCSFITTA